MSATEGSSSVMVAFRFVGKSMSALSTKSNMGDHSYHRLIEEFEGYLTGVLDSEDERAVDYVADCLSRSYKRAVCEPEELAEDLCSDILRIAARLYAHTGELQLALQNHGRHGNIMASYLGKDQAERRVFI